MSSLDVLTQHAIQLCEATGFKTEASQEGNRLYVVVEQYRLPAGVSRIPSTDVLFIGDTQYPLSSMDMFWVELDVVRSDGSLFENSDSIEEHLGRRWRRFSYHRNGIWNSTGNPLMDHFGFMETRWIGKAKR